MRGKGFVDDTLVFSDNSQDEMVHLNRLLVWFKATSRLKANLDKSEFNPNKRMVDVLESQLEMGCKVGEFPST